MRKSFLYFVFVLLHVFSTTASGSYFWECSSSSGETKKIAEYYKKVKDEASYNKVRKLWKALNCKYSGNGRKLVIFFDGTWNDHNTSTNIWTLYNLAVKHAEDNSIIPYYDKGVGSHKFDKFRGGLVGKGISKDIRQAYRFLVEAYKPGDKIYIFGFSRGALAARSLNGMIEYIGLLKGNSINKERIINMNSWERLKYFLEEKKLFSLIKRIKNNLKPSDRNEFVYYSVFRDLVLDLYKDYHVAENSSDKISDTILKNRNKTIEKYSNNQFYKKIEFWKVPIEVIGVFDTVPCLGITCVTDPEKHHIDLYAKKGFHALSIDEGREMFRLLRFNPDVNGDMFKEEWFSGAHSDIGGGYDSNFEGKKSCNSKIICDPNYITNNGHKYYQGLETIPLNWMIENIKGENIIPNDTQFPECNIGKLHSEYFKDKPLLLEPIEHAVKRFVGYEEREIGKDDIINSNVIKRWESKCLFSAKRFMHILAHHEH